jgi:epoxyqueuosine reductase
LCAYEAGLGVYGRSGLILHPVLGNRITIETLLTDAVLPPDKPLKNFDPCGDCEGLCAKACPGRAFDLAKFYPESWTPAKCRVARERLAGREVSCGACWAVCPACTIPDDWLIGTLRVASVFDRGRRDTE